MRCICLAGMLLVILLPTVGCTALLGDKQVVQEGHAAAIAAVVPPNGGKYYLDDGPPADGLTLALADIPDAVARREKINPAHNRPYVVLGKRYVPYTQLQPYRRRGVASWYGRRYHGRKTASGERYDMYEMTAAHPILPIPSYVRVTRPATGKSVVVRINDRGPFLQGREIDLSYVAAAKLGIVAAGTDEVIVQLLLPDLSAAGEKDIGGRVEDSAAAGSEVYIQLAAFSSVAAADAFIDNLSEILPPTYHRRLSVHPESGLYLVQMGPYAAHGRATDDDEYLCRTYSYCGFLTRRY